MFLEVVDKKFYEKREYTKRAISIGGIHVLAIFLICLCREPNACFQNIHFYSSESTTKLSSLEAVLAGSCADVLGMIDSQLVCSRLCVLFYLLVREPRLHIFCVPSLPKHQEMRFKLVSTSASNIECLDVSRKLEQRTRE